MAYNADDVGRYLLKKRIIGVHHSSPNQDQGLIFVQFTKDGPRDLGTVAYNLNTGEVMVQIHHNLEGSRLRGSFLDQVLEPVSQLMAEHAGDKQALAPIHQASAQVTGRYLGLK